MTHRLGSPGGGVGGPGNGNVVVEPTPAGSLRSARSRVRAAEEALDENGDKGWAFLSNMNDRRIGEVGRA